VSAGARPGDRREFPLKPHPGKCVVRMPLRVHGEGRQTRGLSTTGMDSRASLFTTLKMTGTPLVRQIVLETCQAHHAGPKDRLTIRVDHDVVEWLKRGRRC
jgi:hypothetical protein